MMASPYTWALLAPLAACPIGLAAAFVVDRARTRSATRQFSPAKFVHRNRSDIKRAADAGSCAESLQALNQAYKHGDQATDAVDEIAVAGSSLRPGDIIMFGDVTVHDMLWHVPYNVVASHMVEATIIRPDGTSAALLNGSTIQVGNDETVTVRRLRNLGNPDLDTVDIIVEQTKAAGRSVIRGGRRNR